MKEATIEFLNDYVALLETAQATALTKAERRELEARANRVGKAIAWLEGSNDREG